MTSGRTNCARCDQIPASGDNDAIEMTTSGASAGTHSVRATALANSVDLRDVAIAFAVLVAIEG
jgi:hypothetical protein